MQAESSIRESGPLHPRESGKSPGGCYFRAGGGQEGRFLSVGNRNRTEHRETSQQDQSRISVRERGGWEEKRGWREL